MENVKLWPEEGDSAATYLLYKNSYSIDFINKILNEKKLNGIRIFADLFRLSDISFLENFNCLKKLSISSVDDYDFAFLKKMTNLETLSIHCEGKNEIDLSCQKSLKELYLKWRKKISNLDKCTELNDLTLIQFTEKELKKIGHLPKLNRLRILTGSICCLKEIQNYPGLKCLVLGPCRKLSSIGDLNGLMYLETLEIESCKQITDYHLLNKLPELKSVTLHNCGDIDSIKFIENFPKLKLLSLTGDTNVVDGNLKPVKRLVNAFGADRKHYNTKIPNIGIYGS